MRNFGNAEMQPRRNFVLWILAIFAMVDAASNGMTDLMFMTMPGLMSQSVEAVKSLPLFNSPEYTKAFELMLSIKGWQYGLMLLTEIAGFVGAFLMLVKLNPVGFHIYTIGQICQVAVMNLVIGGEAKMGFSAVLMAILIVAMFATQLRFMKYATEDEETPTDDSEAVDESFEDSEESDTED